MNKLTLGIIRFRVAILLIAALLTSGFGAVLPRLHPDDDLLKFLPADNPDIKLFRKVNSRFGGLDVAIVGLEADTMFTSQRLTEIRTLTRNLAEIEGVFDVMSFTEAPDPRPSPFGLVVEPLVDVVPSNDSELDALKARVLANDTAVGNLISEDGKAAMILCFLGGERPPIYTAADIKKESLGVWNSGGIYFGGAPFIRLHIAGGTKEDLKNLTPVVALVVALVTFIIFRKPIGVFLSLGVVGVALVWLMGLLALLGDGLTVVDTSLPTLLVAVGGAYGIHILSSYFNGDQPEVKDRVKEALAAAGPPVIASTLTTCAGFMSFLAMDVAPLNNFGLYASIGIAFTAVLALTVIPAVLSFAKKVPSKQTAGFLAAPMGRIGKWSSNHRIAIIVVACLLSIAGLTGARAIAPDATLKTFFSKGSEPDKANNFLKRNFGGSVYIQVYFEGDMRSPFVLAELRKIVEFTRGMDEVVQVSSIIDPLVMMSEAMGGRADLPINRERTRSLYPFLEGAAAIDQIVSPEKESSLVQIRIRSMAPEDVTQVVQRLREFIDSELLKSIKTIDIAKLSTSEKEALKSHRANKIAKRVLRLANIHSNSDFQLTDNLLKSVASKIENDWPDIVTITDDIKSEVRKVVEEHITGDASPFEEPDHDASKEVIDEWTNRGELAQKALLSIVDKTASPKIVHLAIKNGLPLTTARDEEGLAIVVDSLSSGLSAARDTVRGKRLTDPLLASMGIKSPGKILKDKVAGALCEMDSKVVVRPDPSFAPTKRIKASVTGQPIVNTVLCESTIRNQFKSLVVALVVLTIILSVTFRSVFSAAKALVPPLFTLAMAVGIMGALSIPLDLTTSMIAAIALGIGVDYSIHFLWRRRTRGETLEATTAKVGPSIGANAFQVAAGFAVLAVSDMVPMQRFGALVAMSMLLCAIGTFALLPALRAEGKTDNKNGGTI